MFILQCGLGLSTELVSWKGTFTCPACLLRVRSTMWSPVSRTMFLNHFAVHRPLAPNTRDLFPLLTPFVPSLLIRPLFVAFSIHPHSPSLSPSLSPSASHFGGLPGGCRCFADRPAGAEGACPVECRKKGCIKYSSDYVFFLRKLFDIELNQA